MYKITVTNLDDGKVCMDCTAKAICAGVCADEDFDSHVLSCGDGNAFNYVLAVRAAESAIKKTLENHAIKTMYNLIKLTVDKED